jgi:hypothetical protein
MRNEKSKTIIKPLLPLEYCTIERAAKLLECETDDLWHWEEIGAIKFWTHLNHSEDSGFYVLVGERDFHSFMQLEEATLNKYHHFHFLDFGLSRLLIDDEYFDEMYLKNSGFLVEGSVSGLWIVDTSSFNEAFSNDEQHAFSYFTSSNKLGFEIRIGFPAAGGKAININDLLIVREDLEKLYNSITTGEPLKNRYNSSDVAKEMQKKESEWLKEIKPERLTNGISKATLALTELVLKLSGQNSGMINDPHVLHRKINELLREYKVNAEGGHYIGVTDNGLRDIIAKGRSARLSDSD